jgi:hypothetical protein
MNSRKVFVPPKPRRIAASSSETAVNSATSIFPSRTDS